MIDFPIQIIETEKGNMLINAIGDDLFIPKDKFIHKMYEAYGEMILTGSGTLLFDC